MRDERQIKRGRLWMLWGVAVIAFGVLLLLVMGGCTDELSGAPSPPSDLTMMVPGSSGPTNGVPNRDSRVMAEKLSTGRIQVQGTLAVTRGTNFLLIVAYDNPRYKNPTLYQDGLMGSMKLSGPWKVLWFEPTSTGIRGEYHTNVTVTLTNPPPFVRAYNRIFP